MFSAHFDGKQCKNSFQQPHAYGSSPVQYFGAFRSSFISRVLLELDPYVGNDSDRMFPLFYTQVAWELVPKLTIIFRHLVRGGRFPVCWRLDDVVPVAKGSVFSDIGDYRPPSITSVLSKVVEKIVVGKVTHFLENNSMLLSSQFLYRRSLGACDDLLTLSHRLQIAVNSSMEGKLVQLDFSAAFNRVSHGGPLYKLRSIGVGLHLLVIESEFLSERVRLDGKVRESAFRSAPG